MRIFYHREEQPKFPAFLEITISLVAISWMSEVDLIESKLFFLENMALEQ